MTLEPEAMPSTGFGPLIDAVQRNCDLADAHHAREKSLCTYLLGMREYFRWAAELPLGAAPERAQLGQWIARQEQNWDLLRDTGASSFSSLPLGTGIDPFDEASVNEHLDGHGLVYGAGFGLFGAPLFFLATRDSEVLRDGARVIVAGPELARGVTAPPAASRDGTVIVRLDALRRWLDPDEVDLRAKRRQRELLDGFGGREAALGRGDLGFTPAPGTGASFD